MRSVVFASMIVASGLPTNEARAKIETRELTYEYDGTPMKGFVAYDSAKKGKRPGVLVVHEWWGHNEHARASAKKLAAMGYTAMALDMFGHGKTASHPKDAGAFASAVRSNPAVAKGRFLAALEVLRKEPTVDPDRIAAIGYCFGGGIVLQMARAGVDLDAVASFHGSLDTDTPAKAGNVKAKVFAAHGGADAMVTPEHVAAFKKEMKDAGVELTFVEYPGAQHAFTNPGATAMGKKHGIPVAYDAAADEASWKAFSKFLRGVFGP